MATTEVPAQGTKKLSKAALDKSFRNWSYGNLTCFSQEHMQTFGYLVSMLPIVEELYDTPEEQKEALMTYSAFFNTEPQIGTMVVGITAGLEEARANGEPVTDETINGIRAGLMGPLAGLGDSLIVGTLIPILLGISLGLSTDGSPLGAIFYIVVWNLLMYFGMKFAYKQGYELGGKAVAALVGPKATALRDSIVMIGTMVIGAVAATWVSITASADLLLPGGTAFQATLDGIYPKLLPLLFTLFCWWLMARKKINPVVAMLILVGIAFVGVLVGFFNPGLSY
jgi:mannose/fructose/N-acetylgalactosamine-specific phosphotransferase system component IID